MVTLLFIIGMGLTEANFAHYDQLQDDDYYVFTAEEGLGDFPPGYYEQPLDLDRVEAEELFSLVNVPFQFREEIFPGGGAPPEAKSKWITAIRSKVAAHHPFEVTDRNKVPFTVKVRFKADQRWGGDQPSHPLGPPYGTTERVNIAWARWRTGVILDRDRYENRLADLNRGWLQYGDSTFDFIAGDYTCSTGEGTTFWTSPSYYSTQGVAGELRTKSLKLAPASNTRTNGAIRGAAGGYRYDEWSVLVGAGSTLLDATVASDGRRLNLSNGGLHRTSGESVKRESLREYLSFGAVQHDAEWEGYDTTGLKSTFGFSGWNATYSPGLRPTASLNNPFPSTGEHAGATGVFAAISSNLGEISFENSLDSKGIPAQRGSLLLIEPREEWEEYPNDGSLIQRSIRLAAFNFPPDFRNPHARTISGKEANNLRGASLVVEQKSLSSRSLLRLNLGFDERLWRTAADPTPPTSSYAILESEFTYRGWSQRLRITRRNTDAPDDDPGDEPFLPARLAVTRIRYATTGRWGESWLGPARPGYFPHFWAEIARSDASPNALAVAGSISLTKRYSLFQLFWKVSTGAAVFNTPAALPIYAADVSPPDVFASVRLAGSGCRIWGEIGLETGQSGKLMIRGSRLLPFGGGAKANGALYLTFYQSWGREI